MFCRIWKSYLYDLKMIERRSFALSLIETFSSVPFSHPTYFLKCFFAQKKIVENRWFLLSVWEEKRVCGWPEWIKLRPVTDWLTIYSSQTDSVTRRLDYRSIFGHLQQNKVAQKYYTNFAKVGSKFGQILGKLSETMQKTFLIRQILSHCWPNHFDFLKIRRGSAQPSGVVSIRPVPRLFSKRLRYCAATKKKKWAIPGLFFVLFLSLQTNVTIFITNQCEKCPSFK